MDDLSEHGAGRSDGPSFQEIVRTSIEEMGPGHTSVAPVLQEEHYEYTGSGIIPKERYYSQEWHELEKKHVWRTSWLFAGRESEIAEPGDRMVYTNTTDSIVITRDRDMKIRAFVNVCLHRGRILCDGPDRAQTLRCPFHGFAWNLDGSIHEVPAKWDFTHIEDSDLTLPTVRVATWEGSVFVCMDEKTPDLDVYMAPLQDHFKHFHLEDRYIHAHASKLLACNWKVALEAFIESYHVSVTHPQGQYFVGDTNTQYDNFGGRYNFNRMLVPHGVASPLLGDVSDDEIVENAGLLGLDVDSFFTEGRSARQAFAELERAMYLEQHGVDLSDVNDIEMIDSIQYLLLPNLAPWGGYQQPFLYVYRPNGDDPGSCIMDVYILAPFTGARPADAPVTNLDFEQSWAEAPGFSRFGPVFDQDTANMAAVQKGMMATRRSGATLANYQESRIRHLHDWLTERIEG